ncbi:hypothetical protein GPECTOR_11g28 [Gonium pectorale]|uniref:ABC transporter domain-containing protein n=1 Tax=Gonium pectorale TaxID=33097 RepID=A0A150GPV6_GONPE|nr:hypothetical protein GPECTOR_11g28 [Gonium pectorale]|eukprot:KXZ51841.1 hypothetical protein GPECTOR_11g28 [Gonium pectorale]
MQAGVVVKFWSLLRDFADLGLPRKGWDGAALTAAVDAGIRSVRLHVNDAGRRRVSAYSGGMKRRLSVAIAFIGEPQVVYLVSLAAVFAAMAGARGRLDVLDWGVANATLEEVFIKFARQIGAETRDH